MAKRLIKREQILRAATGVFAHYGYDKTTLDDVGRAVGLNKASLYYYYRSKEELFLAVVLDESRRMIGQIQERLTTIADPEAKILAYMTERLAYYRHVLSLNGVSTESLTVLQPAFNQLYAEIEQGEIRYVTDILRQLPLRSDVSAPYVATLLFKTANALKHEAIRGGGPVRSAGADYADTDADIRHVVGWLLRGIQQPGWLRPMTIPIDQNINDTNP